MTQQQELSTSYTKPNSADAGCASISSNLDTNFSTIDDVNDDCVIHCGPYTEEDFITYCGDFQGKWQWEVGMPQCRGTPNRVLFLSVDGVLHPAETRKDSHFDRTNMAHLNTIIEMTGAALVLSSSWRLKSSWCRDVYEALKDHGIAPFFSRTPRVWHKKEHWWHDDRGLEIKAWVVHHNPKAWVVVDDQEVMVPDGHAFRTDPCSGLTALSVQHIVDLFGKQWKYAMMSQN